MLFSNPFFCFPKVVVIASIKHLRDLFSTELLQNVTITSSGVPISGETYNLTCTVEANVPPTVQWLYSSNGSEVTSSGNITVETEKTTNSTTILTLSFNPLHTSHGEQYTCQSKIDTPPSTVNATRNVTVQGIYIYVWIYICSTCKNVCQNNLQN